MSVTSWVCVFLVSLTAVRAAADSPWTGIWRLRTVVADGPAKLRGVSGRYTVIITEAAGGRLDVALAKEGYGKTEYAPRRVPVGSVRSVEVVPDEGAPLRTTVSLRVPLAPGGGAGSNKAGQALQLDLRLDGDQLWGSFEIAAAKGQRRVVGAALAKRGTALPDLSLTTALPCDVCCDVLYRCGPQGIRGCNSSESCHGECETDVAPRACLVEE